VLTFWGSDPKQARTGVAPLTLLDSVDSCQDSLWPGKHAYYERLEGIYVFHL